MRKSGIEVYKVHHEVAPSQFEIGFRYDEPLKTADRVIIYKYILKNTTRKYGYLATFMPKPFWGLNGSGAHVHLSIWDKSCTKNYCFEEGVLTEFGKKVCGGLLKYSPEITLINAPLVNSYKRLTPDHEAPVYISWAPGNRSTLIRIPTYFHEKTYNNSPVIN